MARPAKKKKSIPRILLRVLIALAAVVCLVLLVGRLYFRLPVKDYYQRSEKAFVIPGLDSGFVPQGISYDAASDSFFLTGYQKGAGASPVYVVNRATGKASGPIRLQKEEGGDFTGHAGGLTVWGDYVYVAGSRDACVYVYSREAILAASAEEKVPCLGSVPTHLGAERITVAFTTAADGLLTVGEFYREPQYPTPESHKYTTPAGDYEQALAVSYRLDETAPLGLDPAPVCAYTLPDQAQGMAVQGSRITVSTSWGASFSRMLTYETEGLAPFGAIEAEGREVPLYALDSASQVSEDKYPPMSEEIEWVDGKLYTMCESASNAYYFGKLTGGQWCYATAMTP